MEKCIFMDYNLIYKARYQKISLKLLIDHIIHLSWMKIVEIFVLKRFINLKRYEKV